MSQQVAQRAKVAHLRASKSPKYFNSSQVKDFFNWSKASNSSVHGLIWMNFELIQVVTYKNEEDPIKIEGARVFTTLNIDFSDAQGQVTP